MPEATELAAMSLHTVTRVETEVETEVKSETKTEESVINRQINSGTQKVAQPDGPVNIKIKEAHVANGVSYLTDLIKLAQENVAEFPICNQWNSEISSLLNRPRSPQTYIGLYGGTGVGKSSLINAMLDGDILQCNSMRAGTSVITIVSYNNDDEQDKRFRAEIETITHDEWITEMKILLGDISDVAEGVRSVAGSSSEAGIAISKLEAIFPGLDITNSAAISFEDLVSKVSLIDILDKTHTFHASSIRKLKKKISGFTSSRGPLVDGVAAWPLVRKIQLYIKAELLKDGVNLVDMPGVCDSNAARTKVAEEYLKNLDAIWVATQQTRAVDDSTAQGLFETSYKLQAERDGKFNTDVVSIIMTKSDDLNVNEVVEDLRLDTTEITEINERRKTVNSEKWAIKSQKTATIKEVAKIRKKITKLRRLLRNCNDASVMDLGIETSQSLPCKRKISQTTEEDSQSQPKDNMADNYQVTTLKEQLRELYAELHRSDRMKKDFENKIFRLEKIDAENLAALKAICVQARNNWSIERRKSAFMNEILELREDLLEAGNEVDTGEVPPPADNLSVFCVSSKAYHHIQGRNNKEPLVPGFRSVEETGIPGLQRHCVDVTLQARQRDADYFLDGLEAFNATLQSWAKDDSPEPQLSISEKGTLDECFGSAFQALEKATKAIANDTFDIAHKAISTVMSTFLAHAAKKAEKSFPKLVSQWFEGDNKLHWASLKAICRRDGGTYANHRGNKFNLNEQISVVFEKAYGRAWGKVVRESILDLLMPLKNVSRASTKELFDSVERQVKDNSPQLSCRLTTSLQRMIHLQTDVSIDIASAFTNFLRDISEVGNLPRERVPEKMNSVYRQCSTDAGRGVSQRNQTALIQHTSNIKNTLYRDIANEMIVELLKHITVLRGALFHAFDSMIQNMRDCLQQMLEQAVSTLRSDVVHLKKAKFQVNILKLMENLTLSNNSQADQVREKLVEQVQEDDAASDESEDDVEDYRSGLSAFEDDDAGSDESEADIEDDISDPFMTEEDDMDLETEPDADYSDYVD